MARGNGSGDCPSDLVAFDALPRALKRVMMCAPRPFAPTMVRGAWRKSGLSSDEYAARMEMKLRLRFDNWHPDVKYTKDAY